MMMGHSSLCWKDSLLERGEEKEDHRIDCNADIPPFKPFVFLIQTTMVAPLLRPLKSTLDSGR